MTTKPETPKFVFLLNAMENASVQANPSNHGYAGHRSKVLDYVAKLETSLIAAQKEVERVSELHKALMAEADRRIDVAEQALRDAQETIERLMDSEQEKILAMSDDQINALIRMEGRDPKDVAKITEQIARIAVLETDLAALRDAKPVAWFKHGPYEDGEKMTCVFEDPHDDVCYSALIYADAAPTAVQQPVAWRYKPGYTKWENAELSIEKPILNKPEYWDVEPLYAARQV